MKSKKGFLLSVLFVFFIFGVTIPLFMSNHRKVKADSITDLTGTTWIINQEVSTFPSERDFTNYYNNEIDGPYNITFVSNSINFTSITFQSVEDVRTSMIYSNRDEDIFVLNYNGLYSWANIYYKTIEITGGTDANNSTFINWLLNNATQYTPTPTGTQITHRYWALGSTVPMTNDSVYSDNDIEYTILFNEQRRRYDETEQIGLVFRGKTTNYPRVYVWSINGDGINLLYMNDSDNNYLDNVMWLEFNIGDYIDTNLYNFMDLQGYWFDDAEAYISGTAQGWVEGIAEGRALGQADGVEYTGLITGIFNGLGNLLSIQVFPNITIGLLIGLPLLLGAFIIIIKILRG